MQLSLPTAAVALAVFASTVVGQETHLINLVNQCGYGTPVLVLANNGTVVSTGSSFLSKGPIHGIAYLQVSDDCGPGGQNCTIVDTLLANSGSSVGIRVSNPFAFNVPVGFSYYYGEGHDGYGSFCLAAGCDGAGVFVNVTAPGATMRITFCPE
ncbi:hypothetical protein GSI_03641 [Ganoderma sinense ZZ0214-1]|uniref:Transporter n=1 Tax=Ganoderma sinense ZZ0214-1 TaxID=1077348 RepID=A0A2G8SJI7_9APHY|nr:hypothetical protein GSI_03641 [Ganoderma sinense ZZ0214-1]